MASELSRQKAAQAWTAKNTSCKEMDVELAESFAEILDEIWSQPWLGNATTLELIDELRARAEVEGYGHHRTVDE